MGDRGDINVLHLSLFFSAAAAAAHGVSSSSGRSLSTVLLHLFPWNVLVSFFPFGAQVNATCGFRFGAIQNMTSIHFFACVVLVYWFFSISALLLISSLDRRMGQWTFKTLLRHVWRNEGSSPFSIAMIFDLKILNLVSRQSSPVPPHL